MADCLDVSRPLANCSAGLTARRTIVAKTPITAMTTRSSINVKPLLRERESKTFLKRWAGRFFMSLNYGIKLECVCQYLYTILKRVFSIYSLGLRLFDNT